MTQMADPAEADDDSETSQSSNSSRVFMTRRERELLTGELDQSEINEPITSYRRVARSRLKDRLERGLGDKGGPETELDILAEHAPDLYEYIVRQVSEHSGEAVDELYADDDDEDTLEYLDDAQTFAMLVSSVAQQHSGDVDESDVREVLEITRDTLRQLSGQGPDEGDEGE